MNGQIYHRDFGRDFKTCKVDSLTDYICANGVHLEMEYDILGVEKTQTGRRFRYKLGRPRLLILGLCNGSCNPKTVEIPVKLQKKILKYKYLRSKGRRLG